MTTMHLCRLHLIGSRNLLGFCQAQMALALGLSPLEIEEAEGTGPISTVELTLRLPCRVEAKLAAFFIHHPLANGLLDSMRLDQGGADESRQPSAA